MITTVDVLVAAVVLAFCAALVEMIRTGNGTKHPAGEYQSAADGDAGPSWVFVPFQREERAFIAPSISRQAKEYVARREVSN